VAGIAHASYLARDPHLPAQEVTGSPKWVREGDTWHSREHPGWRVTDTGRKGRRDRYVIVSPDGTENHDWHRAHLDVRNPGLNHAKWSAEAWARLLGHALRFRRGMTVLERRQYREEVLRRELARAYQAAAERHLSASCLAAMGLTGSKPERARERHAACREEQWGGTGCLCQCHDEEREGVSSGDHGAG
jgi:hypothetical protein